MLGNSGDLLGRRYWEFCTIKQQAPKPKYIEIVPDWRERLPKSGESAQLLKKSLTGCHSLLDVGAGDRGYQEVLKKIGLNLVYRSADQAEGFHDYKDFFVVEDSFDAILMLELVEHVSSDIGIQFISKAFSLLNPGGVLILSTPNADHPNRVWAIELTHVRPWPIPDLYAVLKMVGFSEVEITRQYCRTWKRRLLSPLSKFLHTVMDLDHAQTTICVARKG